MKIVKCDSNPVKIVRLGKKEHNKNRPMKVTLKRSSDVNKALSNSKNLKALQHKIFLKGDKTKAEQKESTRIHKRKQELLDQYPNNDGNPRVVLKKGVLYVDNVEVDRYTSPQTLF